MSKSSGKHHTHKAQHSSAWTKGRPDSKQPQPSAPVPTTTKNLFDVLEPEEAFGELEERYIFEFVQGVRPFIVVVCGPRSVFVNAQVHTCVWRVGVRVCTTTMCLRLHYIASTRYAAK